MSNDGSGELFSETENDGISLRLASPSDNLFGVMREISSSNFGLLIAYLIPGFTALWGISIYSSTVRAWLDTSTASASTIGGFFYATLASLAAGMIVNVLRWLTIDHLHHATGIHYPDCDFAKLQHGLGAYRLLVEFYYRYHEAFGNLLIAGTFSYIVWRMHNGTVGLLPSDVLYLGVAILLWIGSRDTLKKFYQRTEALLRRLETAATDVPKSLEPTVTPSAASSPAGQHPAPPPSGQC